MAAEKILKVMLSVQGEPNIFECSAIEQRGGCVAGPALPSDAGRWIRDARAINQVDQFAHQTLRKPGRPAGYAINVPIPNENWPVRRQGRTHRQL
jgi:hypothetical protein